MELDVTHMVEDSDNMIELSGSQAEHGKDAGRITWNNSVAYGRDQPLLKTDDERDAAREYFRGFGAWSQEEIDGWSEAELQGIMCQDVANAIREMEAMGGYSDKYCERDGRVYRSGDRWYFYVGH